MDIALVGNDILIKNGMPEEDGGLETAVRLSLFTDRRDNTSDDPRGWWADAIEEVPLGSRLWTLERSKMLPTITEIAKDYCREALQWIIDDGLASQIIIDTARDGLYSVFIDISIVRPQGSSAGYRYNYNWEEQTYRPVHVR